MLNLKSYRKQQKLRQCDLAELLGVEQATISKLEAGVISPGLELAFAIEDRTNGAVLARSWLRGNEKGDVSGHPLDDQFAGLGA